DVIQRGALLFDELVVAVGNNPGKRGYWFDLEQRTDLVKTCCAKLDNVRVIAFSGLMVHAAQNNGANVILRGLRALSDFELEFRNGLANRDLSGLETLFILTEPQNIFVASSLVREIAQNRGDVSRYVPAAVNRAIAEKLGAP
ncbi:MAG: pantetheine-phosphate adenylyltransferase, partial [Deltaproteobacteria bacterium]|nr:pantetheine-phosphate adenylyltransferase [Deltaproteobacteria bacterium]